MIPENIPGSTVNLPEAEWDKLNACIHCGMCLSACPTYRVTGSEAESPRGRLYLMRAFAEGKLDAPQQLSAHLDPCLGCLGCVTACPSGVEYDVLLETSRQALLPYQNPIKRRFRRWMLSKVLPNPRRLRLLVRLTRWYQTLGYQFIVRRLGLARLAGALGKTEAFVPDIPAGQKPLEAGTRYGENRRGRVVLFTGCIMNALFTQTHRATIEVLNANGYEVVIPEQTCCGALAHHAGETDIVAGLARQNAQTILAAQPDWIVVNAAGCGSTLKAYDHILSELPEGKEFAEKTVDILELLARHPLEGELQPVPLRVAYHAACHLHHAQRVFEEPYQLLRQIPQLQLVPLVEAEMCCGSAGVYNLAHPSLSQAILGEKMRHVAQTQAEVILAGNPGCAIQLETGIRQAGLPMTVLHPIELLAQAYKPSPLSAFKGDGERR